MELELVGRNMKAHSALFGLFLLLLFLACSTEGDKRFCCSDGKTSITSDKVGEKLKAAIHGILHILYDKVCDGVEDCPLSESGPGGEDEENCPQEAEGKKYPLQCTVTLVFPSIQGEACSFFVLYQQAVEVIGGRRRRPGATWKKSRCQVTVFLC